MEKCKIFRIFTVMENFSSSLPFGKKSKSVLASKGPFSQNTGTEVHIASPGASPLILGSMY
ncbi:MAG: hypothetical protein JNL49_05370 [Bacteroidia bacterium]|nr:hypothetical protein [Bacteroidia bacterium]